MNNALSIGFRLALISIGLASPLGVAFLWAADNRSVPTFTLYQADGPAVTGTLSKLGDDWSITLNSTTGQGTDFVSLRRAEVPLPALPTEAHVILVNGDRLPGRVVELADERLDFRVPLGGEQQFSLPLSAVAIIWLSDPAGVEGPEQMRRQLLAATRTRDVVLLRNGDRVEGTLSAIDRGTGQVRVEAETKDIRIERDKVAVIALNTELARSLRPRSSYGHVVLANGGRLGLATARCDEGRTLSGKTLFGAAVKIPLDQVIALDLYQGRAVYLSDLKPKSYRHTAYNGGGLSWPWVRDGSVVGDALRLGGGTHDKGLGLHSQCVLTYDLGGAYRRFEALVGLDDQTGRDGCVRIQVLVDGQPRAIGGDQDWTWRDGPRPVRVDVTGARELTLSVAFGQRGAFLLDTQNHVNWADARLMK